MEQASEGRKEDASVSISQSDENNDKLAQVDSLIDVDIQPLASQEPLEPLMSTRNSTLEEASANLSEEPDSISEPAQGGISGEEKCDKTGGSIESDSTVQQEGEQSSLLATLDVFEELTRLKVEKQKLDQMVAGMQTKLNNNKAELEREVQKRVDLEQRFTEEAKRTTDQIEELIGKSACDDARLAELKKKFDLYTRETSSMIENFTTNRELLASQLIELRKENDYLLGKYLSKARDLQSADIDLPQSVEELQFHCLTLNEKLILTTLAKERLEETLVQTSVSTNRPTLATTTSQT